MRLVSPEVAGDSPATSFRELDDAFLQRQTRIWLGEVLRRRFSEETSVADLLADGELLFLVSKVVRKMLLKRSVDLKHSKAYVYEQTPLGKTNERYMPYQKIDSFLKTCKLLGMIGIDMFSPSDVVERRYVRRVCICIRSFSKMARSNDLNVPDFDLVRYNVAMSNSVVGGIRRNLEQARSGGSASNGSSPVESSGPYAPKTLTGYSSRYNGSCSESDEVESRCTEVEARSPGSSRSFSGAYFSSSSEGDSVFDGSPINFRDSFNWDSKDQVESRLSDWHSREVFEHFVAENSDTSASSASEASANEKFDNHTHLSDSKEDDQNNDNRVLLSRSPSDCSVRPGISAVDSSGGERPNCDEVHACSSSDPVGRARWNPVDGHCVTPERVHTIKIPSKPPDITGTDQDPAEAPHDPNSRKADDTRKPGTAVLASVAGGITLVGAAISLFLLFRGGRGSNGDPSGGAANRKLPQEDVREDEGGDEVEGSNRGLGDGVARPQGKKLPKQKQAADTGGRVLYPGDRLKL